MKQDRASLIGAAFMGLGLRNPLLSLGEADRDFLVSVLQVYSHALPGPAGAAEIVEEAERVANTAAALAEKMKHLHLDETFRTLWPLESKMSSSLLRDLGSFSQRIKHLSHIAGKPGQKAKTEVTQWLVFASLFVYVKTSDYQDEALGELLQNVSPRLNEERYSGDGIRKRRMAFKTAHPDLYKSLLIRMDTIIRTPVLPSHPDVSTMLDG